VLWGPATRGLPVCAFRDDVPVIAAGMDRDWRSHIPAGDDLSPATVKDVVSALERFIAKREQYERERAPSRGSSW